MTDVIYVCHVTDARGRTKSRTKFSHPNVGGIAIFLDDHDRVILVRKNGDRINWTKEER